VEQDQSPEPAPEPRGFVQYLPDLFLAPGEAFTAIHRKPGFWIPLVVLVALALVFTAIWMQQVDLEVFMRTQLEESPRTANLPPEQIDQIVNQQLRITPIFAWVGAALGSPILILIVAAAMLAVFRFFLASELGFKESMAITSHSYMTVSLLQTPLMLLTFWLKGDWNINPREILSANLTLLLDKGDVSPALWGLAGSLDLFSFWTIFLMSVGYGVATRRSTSSASIGVLIPWVLWIAITVAWAAFMG
jgi:hypothetical protein